MNRKIIIAGLLLLFVVTVSGCASNKPNLTVCNDLDGSAYVCEKRHETETSKAVDDFLHGAESSAERREKELVRSNQPPKDNDKSDVTSGIINSILGFFARLF